MTYYRGKKGVSFLGILLVLTIVALIVALTMAQVHRIKHHIEKMNAPTTQTAPLEQSPK